MSSNTDVKTRVTPQSSAPASKVRGRDCVVIIYSPEESQLGKRFTLGNSAVQLGRGSENTIVLSSDSVSRRHARIEGGPNGYRLFDLNSTNGTYVNDEPIQEQALTRGDQIKIGDTILKYLSGQDVESQYHEAIYRMTIVDGLTGVHNKRYLLETLDREIARSKRHGRPLSLLMVDLDHFKKLNDRFGHLAGDYVLKEVAQLVSARVRPDDVVARYGGEEFAILLPETSIAGGETIANELREMIENEKFEFERERIKVTASFGLAQLDPAWDANKFVGAADQLLYEAKNAGRNRVCK